MWSVWLVLCDCDFHSVCPLMNKDTRLMEGIAQALLEEVTINPTIEPPYLTQDWGNRLLESTNKTLYAPGPRRKEQCPHKWLTQTCLSCSWESLGLQGDPASKSSRKSVLNIHWKDWLLKLKLQHFGPPDMKNLLIWKTLMLRKIEGGRRRGWQRMRWLDGITNCMDMSLSWWWIGKPGMLQSMGLQRATELIWFQRGPLYWIELCLMPA